MSGLAFSWHALDKKLARDLWRIRGQALAIALVIGSGISLFIMSDGMLTSLEQTMQTYYDRTRFADVYAPVKRAPNHLLTDIARIDGVAAAEGRVVAPLLVDLPEEAAPISGLALSFDPDADHPMNGVHLTGGRMLDPTRPDEILLLEPFATSRGIAPGDSIAATINGAKHRYVVAGVALSPEFIYTIPTGELVPNDSRFAVMWVGHEALAETFDLDGAFNNVILDLSRGAKVDHVIDRLDQLLSRYGATGAYSRDDQLSNKFLTEELKQLDMMGNIMPPIFLAVAAFLLNIVIARLVEAEREEIGLMKAFGYSNAAVGLHYLKFVLAIALFGALCGCFIGLYLGHTIAGVYQYFYSFPFLIFSAPTATFVVSVGISLTAATVGAVASVQRAVRLTPAEAMRPPAPPDFSHSFSFRHGLGARLDEPTRMILRRLSRQPGRALLTSLGVAAAMALSVTMRFNNDAINYMVDVSFNVIDRYNVFVSFTEATSSKAIYELQSVNGVIAVEPVRNVPVRIRNGPREFLGSITGLQDEPSLSRPVDVDLRSIDLRSDGVVMSEELAEILDIRPGELLTFEVLEGRQPVITLPVASTARTLIGTPVFLHIDALNRALGDPPSISGAYLSIDTAQREQVYNEIKDMSRVAAVSLRDEAQAAFQEMVDEGPGTFRYIMTVFAIIIAAGVVYNSARIALAERSRDLASLRVLGFTKMETSYVLLGELAATSLAALPIGALLGYMLSMYIADAFSTELYQIPLILNPDSYGYAALVILISAVISGFLVQRDVNRIDLVSALKSRD